MKADNFDLTEASRAYAVANTPLFLIRKLSDDPAVRTISEACTGEEILSELERTIQSEPQSALEAVRPYALVVALSLKSTNEHLNRAAAFTTSSFGWYGYITQVLTETYSPITRAEIDVPGTLLAPAVESVSESPTMVNAISF
jgi:hypothetical protein